MPKIIAVTGPIGYGKFTQAQKIVAANPKYEISSIDDGWKEFKSSCLKSHEKHLGHTLVVTNGGSLFFHGEKKHVRINITEVHAPTVLIEFLSKFKPVELSGITHEDFIDTDYWKNAYGLMTNQDTSCGKKLQTILNGFFDIIEQTCEERTKNGTFKLRTETSSDSSISGTPETSSDSSVPSVPSASEVPELRRHRHPNHANYLFDSLEQSISELSHYCEKNIRYQLCLILWAKNSPQIALHGY